MSPASTKSKTQSKSKTSSSKSASASKKNQGQTQSASSNSKAKAASASNKKQAPKTQSASATTKRTKSSAKKQNQRIAKAIKGARKTTQARSKTSAPKTSGTGQKELVPTLALEEYEVKAAPISGVKDTSRGSTKFGWIGTGQCGGRLAKSFHDLGYGKVLAVNTAYHDLNDLDLPSSQKILMDIGRKGAGKDMVRGQQAATQYRQDIIHSIEQIFSENVDHIMLALGAGGGTGSGSVLPLIDTVRTCAKHIGLRNPERKIGVLMTLPTDGEAASPKVGRNAYEVASELSRMAANGEISPLIIIDNEKISRMYPGLTVKSFWPTINTTVSGLFDIFNRLSALSSPYTSFDSVDYQSIMESGGSMIMGLTKVDYFQRRYDISEAMKSNLGKTLLAGGFNLESARVAGAIVVGGKQIMAGTPGLQDSINHAFDVLTDLTGQATIHRGIYEDTRDSLRVYTIIGGLDSCHERLEELIRVS